MKIESSRQTFIEQTDERTNERRLAFLELLSEPKNITGIWLAFTSPKVMVSKQMWSYSISSFVADNGGLLGLFVGFNFLMIWDFAILMKQKIN